MRALDPAECSIFGNRETDSVHGQFFLISVGLLEKRSHGTVA